MRPSSATKRSPPTTVVGLCGAQVLVLPPAPAPPVFPVLPVLPLLPVEPALLEVSPPPPQPATSKHAPAAAASNTALRFIQSILVIDATADYRAVPAIVTWLLSRPDRASGARYSRSRKYLGT